MARSLAALSFKKAEVRDHIFRLQSTAPSVSRHG